MKFKISLLAVLMLGIAFTGVVFARSSIVTLVNHTGRDIRSIYVSPSAEDDWERCSGRLDDGDDIEIYVEIGRNERYWDIRCNYTNGKSEVWYGVNFYDSDIITLKSRGRHDTDDYDDDDDDWFF